MKKILLTLTAFFVGVVGFAAVNFTSDEPQAPIRILIDKTKPKLERDLGANVEAYILPSQKLIELQLFELGPTTVYVVDSFGQLIYQEEVDGDDNFVTFGAPETGGNYTLVIWSPYFYGEGTFSIR